MKSQIIIKNSLRIVYKLMKKEDKKVGGNCICFFIFITFMHFISQNVNSLFLWIEIE